MEEVELKLEQDRTEYFYMREETFTVRLTRTISSSSNIIKLLRKISWNYTLVQKSNYNIKLINQSMKLIDDLERLLHIYKMNKLSCQSIQHPTALLIAHCFFFYIILYVSKY